MAFNYESLTKEQMNDILYRTGMYTKDGELKERFKIKENYMQKTYELYTHHDKTVWADVTLKGKHREHCLCFNCTEFNPNDRESNCKIANLLYTVCVNFNLVTPVYECPHFRVLKMPK